MTLLVFPTMTDIKASTLPAAFSPSLPSSRSPKQVYDDLNQAELITLLASLDPASLDLRTIWTKMSAILKSSTELPPF